MVVQGDELMNHECLELCVVLSPAQHKVKVAELVEGCFPWDEVNFFGEVLCGG